MPDAGYRLKNCCLFYNSKLNTDLFDSDNLSLLLFNSPSHPAFLATIFLRHHPANIMCSTKAGHKPMPARLYLKKARRKEMATPKL